jgi:hypothetical protein
MANIFRNLTCCIAAFAIAAALASPPRASAQEPFKRGLEQISFIPKGQIIGGISVSYQQNDFDNYQFLVIENMNGDTYSFKVSPMALYCFKDNLAIGGRAGYSRSKTKLNSADIIVGEDTSFGFDNLYSISHNYFGTAVFRNYISLGQSMRFGFFNEVQLELGGGQSKLINGRGDELTGTYERNFNLGVGLTPGIIMFLSNYSAIEVSIGVLGFNYTHTHSISDQIYHAKRDSKSANFRINLFSVAFGVAFYI